MGDVVIEAPNSPGKASSIKINKHMKAETEELPACRSENGSTLASNHGDQEEKHEKILSRFPSWSVESTYSALGGEKSERKELPTCRSENGSTLAGSHGAQEEKHEKIVNRLPSRPVESTHGALGGEMMPPLWKDVEELKVAENHSNTCQDLADWEHAEAATTCELFDPGDSVQFMDTETAATLRDTTAGTVGENSELLLFTKAPNGFECEDRLKILSEGNFNRTLKTIPEDLNKPFDGSHGLTEINYTGHSLCNSETVVSPRANERFPRENLSDLATEPLGSHTSMRARDALNFLDVSEHQRLVQEISTAVVVSTDLNGWQRFDAEESENKGILGFEKTIAGASQNQPELWEQLLEDGLEGSAQCTPMATAAVKAEVCIKSSVHDGNESWLASPGNPFIEDFARPSSVSETDGFVTNVNFVSSQSLHDYGVEAPFERPIQTGGIVKYAVEQNMGSNFNDMHSDGSKRIARQRFDSFSDIRRSSSRPRDTFYPNCKEQGLTDNAHVDEAGGDKWEANFDLGTPAIHDGLRSLSLPREAGQVQRQGRLSSFLSPKLSPLAKKVACKVRTSMDQEMNVSHQGKGPKAVGKQKSRKWTWRCCMCCAHES
ncbi:hypothetical protein GOP47_0004290 [Adiantum capillus-veneris]|uniref:Uncharacterized protein n=1 Tax=Adiantum capillus-veneris TaxID=13818 RepID=A0A9D4V7U7_ADICA|nr:hypothetical protein GOP47_0004290 [Adiantum capillus-veneris]